MRSLLKTGCWTAAIVSFLFLGANVQAQYRGGFRGNPGTYRQQSLARPYIASSQPRIANPAFNNPYLVNQFGVPFVSNPSRALAITPNQALNNPFYNSTFNNGAFNNYGSAFNTYGYGNPYFNNRFGAYSAFSNPYYQTGFYNPYGAYSGFNQTSFYNPYLAYPNGNQANYYNPYAFPGYSQTAPGFGSPSVFGY